MKKIVFKGFAMLLCGAAFTACSHHEASFDEGYQAKSKALQREAQYQDAFVKAFGPIASGHQWGFDQTAVAGTRAGMAEADDFSGWSVPNDLTSFKEGSKTAKAIRSAFVNGQGTDNVSLSFTNYWMQHACEPDHKNGQKGFNHTPCCRRNTSHYGCRKGC
jgi:hypothetical protein